MKIANGSRRLSDVLRRLSKEKVRVVYAFAQWLSEEELTSQELRMINGARKQFREGRFVWWRDVKRT